VKQGLLGEAWNNCGKTSRHSHVQLCEGQARV